MKYFVVSDIHSFDIQLKNALKAAGFEKTNKDHTLIVCGDIFDRGAGTMELFKFLYSIPKKRCILIKGNHEDLYLELLKKKFPDGYDFSNHTVDTFCHIAGYSPEIMTAKYWYKLGEENPYERMQQTWQEILKEVRENKITGWLKSNQWRNFYELDKYIFVHSFIPLINLDGQPSWYINNRKFHYFANWRTDATELEWYDARWGCPYQNYLDGYFKHEEEEGKVLVCGHWVVTDFRQAINNRMTDNTDIYYSEHLIGLDCGVWHYKGTSGYYHPQNVLVIDDSDFDTCYDQRGNKLEYEKSVPIIRTVTPKDGEEF